MVIANPDDVDEEALKVKLTDIKEFCDEDAFDAIDHLVNVLKRVRATSRPKRNLKPNRKSCYDYNNPTSF
jgi:hypothetical protein